MRGMKGLVSDEMQANFATAIDEREGTRLRQPHRRHRSAATLMRAMVGRWQK